jgi:hypothetical protein
MLNLQHCGFCIIVRFLDLQQCAICDSVAFASVCRQHRQLGTLQHMAGEAAKHRLVQRGVAVAAHDQQDRPDPRAATRNVSAADPMVAHQPMHHHIRVVPAQRVPQPLGRAVIRLGVLVDGQDDNALRLGDEWVRPRPATIRSAVRPCSATQAASMPTSLIHSTETPSNGGPSRTVSCSCRHSTYH